MSRSGRQQTEGPQAMEQFEGKSCLEIWIMHMCVCVFRSVPVEMSVLSLSIPVTMACVALDYCKVNAPRHLVTFSENLQRN